MACSSFHGKIYEIPGISVDNFERADEVQARAYFLSHCHTDHTKGIYSPALLETLKKTKACLYMSAQTAAVINDETKGRLMEYVRSLKLGTTLITLPSIPEQNLDELNLNVTIVPAGHSFGSVMFIFRTNTKTVLFTGDFRISSNDVSKYNHFHKGVDPIMFDAMYVDTTFINHDYLYFPKRSTSVEYAVEEIKKWLEKGEGYRIALHTSAKYGYEFVFNELFNKLKMKVYVSEERWRVYSKFPKLIPSVTNDENSTKIHICGNRTEIYKHFQCLTERDSDLKYLYVHLSAMKWNKYQVDDETFHRRSDNRLDVCFPTHCSRSELIYFINYFPHKKVVGFPNDYCPESPLKNDVFEVTPTKKRLNSPKSDRSGLNKIDRKVDNSLLKEMFKL